MPALKLPRTCRQKDLEAEWGVPMEEILQRLDQEGVTDEEVCSRLRIDRTTHYQWRRELGFVKVSAWQPLR